MRSRRTLAVAALACAGVAGGCGTLQVDDQLVDAVYAYHQQIGGEYLDYVREDESLDADGKRVRQIYVEQFNKLLVDFREAE